MEIIHTLIQELAKITISCLDLISILIVIIYSIIGLINLLKKENQTKYMVLQALSLALTFRLSSEIVRTITVHTMDEIIQIAAIIAIKAAITFLIHWEIKNEEEKGHISR